MSTTDETREGLTEYDFRVQDEGSIVVLHPQNDWARDWLYEHVVDPQWWGGGVVIEPRYLSNLLGGIEAEDGRWMAPGDEPGVRIVNGERLYSAAWL